MKRALSPRLLLSAVSAIVLAAATLSSPGVTAAATSVPLTWSQAVATTPSGWNEGLFFDVSCVSASDCWSSGLATSSATTPVVEHWNGKRWETGSLGLTGKFEDSGITCVAANDCLLSGGTSRTKASSILVYRYNGKAWAPVPKLSGAGFLSEIVCPSATTCIGVGWRSAADGKGALPIAGRYNGKTWQAMTVPKSGEAFSSLDEVQCPTATDCVAPGVTSTTASGAQSLFSERYNGKTWSAVAIAQPVVPGKTPSALPSDLVCTAADSCLIAGYAALATGATTEALPLLYRWNGAKWSAVSLPAAVQGYMPVFNDLACTSANACWIVGYGPNAKGQAVAAAGFWNGSTLTAGSTAAFSNAAMLDAVGCVAGASCVALGGWENLTTKKQGVLAEKVGMMPATVAAAPGRPGSSR